MNLDAAITDVLDRLGDLANTIWDRNEIKQYYKDGYDTFCRRARPFFDQHVIENLPPSGNWQSDFERYEALQRAGWGVTDMPFNMNSERDRNRSPGNSRVGESYATMPTGMTSPSERQFVDSVDSGASGVNKSVAGGRLPPSTVEVLQVAWNSRVLVGSTTLAMRQLDPNYQIRVGDPQSYLWDQDGLYFMRFVPMASGNAEYQDIVGGFGTLTQQITTTTTTTAPIFGGHATLPNGIVSYWNFDETSGTRLDSVTTTGHGLEDHNNNTPSTTGISNQALSLGSTRYLSSPTNVPQLSSTFTVSYWIYRTLPNHAPVLWNGNHNDLGLKITEDVTDGDVTVYTPTSGSDTVTAAYTPTGAIPLNTWCNVIVTYDGTQGTPNNRVKVYVNTVSKSLSHNGTHPSSIHVGTGLFVGFDDHNIFLSGYLDEMGIWSRVLTAQEITDLYASGVGLFYGGQTTTTTTVTTIDANGNDTKGYGILNYIDGSEGEQEVGMFPAYGPWGTPTQIHPHTNNFVIEVTRLGRDLDAYPIELPLAYQKYVIYWAMAHALRRDGPGQDMALSEHYMSRFEMGVSRMELHRDKMNRDRLGAFGARTDPVNFTLGLPQLPYPYDSNQWS